MMALGFNWSSKRLWFVSAAGLLTASACLFATSTQRWQQRRQKTVDFIESLGGLVVTESLWPDWVTAYVPYAYLPELYSTKAVDLRHYPKNVNISGFFQATNAPINDEQLEKIEALGNIL